MSMARGFFWIILLSAMMACMARGVYADSVPLCSAFVSQMKESMWQGDPFLATDQKNFELLKSCVAKSQFCVIEEDFSEGGKTIHRVISGDSLADRVFHTKKRRYGHAFVYTLATGVFSGVDSQPICGLAWFYDEATPWMVRAWYNNEGVVRSENFDDVPLGSPSVPNDLLSKMEKLFSSLQ